MCEAAGLLRLCIQMSGTTDPKIPLPSPLERLLNVSMDGEFPCVSESEMGSSEGSSLGTASLRMILPQGLRSMS